MCIPGSLMLWMESPLGVLYDNQEVLERVRKEAIDYHLCQDCIDKLGIQEFVDSPWDVEKQARYDYHG